MRLGQFRRDTYALAKMINLIRQQKSGISDPVCPDSAVKCLVFGGGASKCKGKKRDYAKQGSVIAMIGSPIDWKRWRRYLEVIFILLCIRTRIRQLSAQSSRKYSQPAIFYQPVFYHGLHKPSLSRTVAIRLRLHQRLHLLVFDQILDRAISRRSADRPPI